MKRLVFFIGILYLASCNSAPDSNGSKSDSSAAVSSKMVSDSSAKKPTDSTGQRAADTVNQMAAVTSSPNVLADPLVIDALKNFQWQWDNCTDGGGFIFDINGLNVFNSSKNYSVFTALERHVKGPGDDGFNMLLNGQRHNPPVQDEYRKLLTKYGGEIFWELVCSASDDRHPANLKDAAANISWLRQNNAGSYNSAKRDFGNKQFASAMYWLMWGQRHNPSIQETFRGTFRDQRDDFIKLLN